MMASKPSAAKKGKTKGVKLKASPEKQPSTTIAALFKKQFLQQELRRNSTSKSSKEDCAWNDDVIFVKEECISPYFELSTGSSSGNSSSEQLFGDRTHLKLKSSTVESSICDRDRSISAANEDISISNQKKGRLAARLSLNRGGGRKRDVSAETFINDCAVPIKSNKNGDQALGEEKISISELASSISSSEEMGYKEASKTVPGKGKLSLKRKHISQDDTSLVFVSPEKTLKSGDKKQVIKRNENELEQNADSVVDTALKMSDSHVSCAPKHPKAPILELNQLTDTSGNGIVDQDRVEKTDTASDGIQETKSDENQNVEEGRADGSEEMVRYRVPYYLENFNTVIKSVFEDDYNVNLFDETDMKHLAAYNNLSESSQKLYVRLFSRKLAWLSTPKIKYSEIADDLKPCLSELVDSGLLISGENLDDLSQVLHALPAPDLRNLAKSYHLNPSGQQKEQIIKNLLAKSQQSTVASLFGKKIGGVRTAMLKKAKQLLGPLYQLQKDARAVFVRAMMLSSLVNTRGDEESGNGGQGQLFQMLLVNMGQIVYPKYSVNRQTRIFSCRQDLIRFETALQLETELLGCTGNGNWSGAFSAFLTIKDHYEEMMKDTKITEWDRQLPDFLRSYTAGSVLVRLLSQGIEILQRRKDYTAAVNLIRQLLGQDVYNTDHHGYWWDRLALNLDVHLKQQEQALQAIQDGLADSNVRTGHRLSLYLRAEAICSKHKSFRKSLKDFHHEPLLDLPKAFVEGRVLPHSLPGSRYQFITETSYTDGNMEDVTMCNVEQIVLDHYRSSGFPQGIHAEGSVVSSLFCLYFWEEMFEDVADAFHSPYQATPLDFHSDSFYERRQKSIDDKLTMIEDSSEESLLAMMEETWNKQNGVMCTGINWERFLSVQEIQGLVSCMGGKVLAGILRRYVQQPRHTRGGFPDLTLWNVESKQIKISEVKGPGDRLSHKQMMWLDFLLKLGVDAEVCHVKPVGVKKLKPPA